MDITTRRRKQQKLMLDLVERKVRSRAQQLYETRGQGEGHALQDWVQAESEVLGNSILAPLYRRLRGENPDLPRPSRPRTLPAANRPPDGGAFSRFTRPFQPRYAESTSLWPAPFSLSALGC